MDFREKWLAAVERKNSTLVVGLDPAEFDMREGDERVPCGMSKLHFILRLLGAAKDVIAGIKFNTNYWKAPGDNASLALISEYCLSEGLLRIEDAKLADIGATNDAGFYHGSKRADAVTVAPFAWNFDEIAKYSRARQLAAICMCLMSSPGYVIAKNNLIPLSEEEAKLYETEDIFRVTVGDRKDVPHARQYQYLACKSRELGLEGLVIGAPSKKNFILPHELTKAHHYSGSPDSKILTLYPGVGAQTGEISPIYQHFPGDMVIVNVGRGIMFAKGINTTPADQAAAATWYRDEINKLRAAA